MEPINLLVAPLAERIQVIPTPQEVNIALTGRCNLKCHYCFYADEMVALGDISTKEWLRFFEEMGEAGVMRVTLTGGEAFTRRDLFILIDGIIANRMRYALLTNGTLIREETIEQLNLGKRRQRLNYVQVSIDGSSREIHDAHRPKSFERAVRGLRLLKENGFPIIVRVTITKHNFHDLENIAHMLLEDIGLPMMMTNEAMTIGEGSRDAAARSFTYRPNSNPNPSLNVLNGTPSQERIGCQNDAEVALNAVERLEAMRILARLEKKYPGKITSNDGPQKKRQMYADMERTLRTGEQAEGWQMGRLTACGCTFKSLAVMHDGTYVPCHMMPESVLGNIGTHSLVDVWQNANVLKGLRGRRSLRLEALPECRSCQYGTVCNGGCPGLAEQFKGDVNVASPDFCYTRFRTELSELGVPDAEVEDVLFA